MENNLQHHGIPGQKWGVRRFQNKDGSLTKLGKTRVSSLVSTQKRRLPIGTKIDGPDENRRLPIGTKIDGPMASKIPYGAMTLKDTVKSERKEASKNRRTLSDADLKKRIERMKLEKEMKDLTDADLSPGKKFINDVLSTSGRRVATTVVTGATLYAIKAGLEGKIDLKEAASYLAPKPKNK